MIIIDSDNMSRPQATEHYLQVRHKLSNDCSDISIVVLAFGRLTKTRRCVENILKYTKGNFELVLLDNGSLDQDISAYFESVEYPAKKIIRMTKNITGVYAVNKILHSLQSKYVVWVNNDIIVTQNWLDNLLCCMESDDSIGIVCPLSSNVSNLQQETLGGFSSLEEMQRKAAAFNVSDPSKWEERIRLIPTAILYRREIFDVVGVYDLGFMHDFGDDDFTFRVRRAGYKLMVCRDTFVHHDHDQQALPQERMDIIQQSRKFFTEKYHGVDVWEDGINVITDQLTNVCFADKKDKRILALDVKCGVPILDAKNYLRKQHIGVSVSKAYTTDSKYLADLQSIADEVVCGDVEETIYREEEVYDIVILGKPLNEYHQPFELLRKLTKLRDQNGYLLLSVKNTDDIMAFARITGMIARASQSHPRVMSYVDVLKALENMGLKHGDVFCDNYDLEDKTLAQVYNMLEAMELGDRQSAAFQHLCVDTFKITAF